MRQRCGKYVAKMWQRCSKDVTKMLQRCCKDVAKMLQRCGKDVAKNVEKPEWCERWRGVECPLFQSTQVLQTTRCLYTTRNLLADSTRKTQEDIYWHLFIEYTKKIKQHVVFFLLILRMAGLCRPQSTYGIYQSTTVYVPSSEWGPRTKGGGGRTRLRVRGWGESQFGRLEKKPNTLSTL
jgi:hypothetical protein